MECIRLSPRASSSPETGREVLKTALPARNPEVDQKRSEQIFANLRGAIMRDS
jgi:hypothetical protein